MHTKLAHFVNIKQKEKNVYFKCFKYNSNLIKTQILNHDDVYCANVNELS